MQYSEATDKIGKYQVSGTIFADTVRILGHKLDEDIEQDWLSFMSGLATADELAEYDPKGVTIDGLATWLGLNGLNPKINENLEGLISANIGSLFSTSLQEHFKNRGLEAHHVSELLRWQTPSELAHQIDLWRQMSKIAQAGIYLDSLADAPEDAEKIEQFSAGELAIGATKNLIRVSTQIRPKSWQAILLASRRLGLDKYLLITKPLKMAKSALTA